MRHTRLGTVFRPSILHFTGGNTRFTESETEAPFNNQDQGKPRTFPNFPEIIVLSVRHS